MLFQSQDRWMEQVWVLAEGFGLGVIAFPNLDQSALHQLAMISKMGA